MSIADGVPGLEGRMAWGAVTLNDTTASPHAKVDKITGWRSLPELEEQRIGNTGRHGETALTPFHRGRTMVYEGRVRARTRGELNALVTALEGAFWGRDGQMTLTRPGSADQWFYNGRVMQFDLDDEVTVDPRSPWPWRHAFVLGVRQADPRVYWSTAVTVAAASGGSTTATNQGTKPTDPVFEVVTAGGTVTVVNGTTGRELRFDDLPAGTLVIDFASRQTLIASNDAGARLNVLNSDWWDEGVNGLEVGANNIGATGGSWTATFRHAF